MGFALVACAALTGASDLTVCTTCGDDVGMPEVEAAADSTIPIPPDVVDSGPVCTEPPCAVEIAAAGRTTCARLNDGTVKCWGFNETGTVGAAIKDAGYAVPQRVAFAGPVDEIALGGFGKWPYGCGRRGATVECWGEDNADLVLGRGGDASAGFAPVPAPVPGVTGTGGLGPGAQLACAVVSGGALSCWGKTYDNVLHPTAVPWAAPSAVKQVVGGRKHHCVLLDTEEVACGGSFMEFRPLWNDASRPIELDLEKIPGLTGIVRITSIDAHVCALNKGGSVLCWGRNQRGELGRGNTNDLSLTPAPVVLPANAKGIGSAVNHSCAILVDDTVWCWGGNASRRPGGTNNVLRGQVGALPDGGVDLFTATPRRIGGLPAGAVRAVAGGYEHSCALMASGAVYCWGSNSHGQLGRGKEDASADNLPHPIATRVVF